MDPGYFWYSRHGRVCKCHQPLWQAAPVPSDGGALVTFLPYASIAQAEGKAGSITQCHSPSRCRGKCVLLSPGEYQLQHPSGGSPLRLLVTGTRTASRANRRLLYTYVTHSHSEQIPTGLSSFPRLDQRGNFWGVPPLRFGVTHRGFRFESAALLQSVELEALGLTWDQLCSSAELAQDKYLFPNSPTSKSSSLCQPAVWQELFPALIHCNGRAVLVPGREQH